MINNLQLRLQFFLLRNCTTILQFGRFFKKYFPQNFFFLLLLSVIIFDICVVRLVKDRCGVMIAIGVFVPDLSHLIYDLSLRGVGSHLRKHLLLNAYLRVLRLRRLNLACWLVCKVIASQEEHLFVKTADYRNFWLNLLLNIRCFTIICCCRF